MSSSTEGSSDWLHLSNNLEVRSQIQVSDSKSHPFPLHSLLLLIMTHFREEAPVCLAHKIPYPDGPNISTRILYKRELLRARKGDVKTEAEVGVMQEDKPRNMGNPRKSETKGNRFSLEPLAGAQPTR